jgi:hypothetical protein
VPRSPYLPHDFECLYRHSCPYLDGLSTPWGLEEYRRATEVYQEHLRIIDSFDGNLKARDDRIRRKKRSSMERGPRVPRPPRRERTKDVVRPWAIRDGAGPNRTVLIGPWMYLLRRSVPIVNPIS